MQREAEHAARAGPRVRFVVAPYLPEHQPALGVSSLSAVLRAAGIRSDVRYLNVEHHQEIGSALYKFVSQGIRSELLVGEMLFARALLGEQAPAWEAFVARLEAELDGASLEVEAPGYLAGHEDARLVTNRLTVVTRNVGDFEKAGCDVVDPFEA